VPSLKCTYGEFLEILKAHGFVLHRHDGSSHQRWKGKIGGEVRMVDFSPHLYVDYVPLGTLQTMIRQSGLPKKLFRK
jgi:predicted RNA binding protein YcfA (HicA-like mRNA interferase family)